MGTFGICVGWDSGDCETQVLYRIVVVDIENGSRSLGALVLARLDNEISHVEHK